MPFKIIRLALSSAFIFMLSPGWSMSVLPMDSIGIEERNGKKFILHKVDAKETLYGISKRYNVSIDEIHASNPEAVNGLRIEDVILVPYKESDKQQANSRGGRSKSSNDSTAKLPTALQVPEGQVHVVKPSETLFSISKRYEIPIESLQEWNELESYAITVGQAVRLEAPKNASVNTTLTNEVAISTPEQRKQQIGESSPKDGGAGTSKTHQVEQGETLYSISRKYDISVAKIQSLNNLDDMNISLGQELILAEGAKEIEASSPEYTQTADRSASNSQNTESGNTGRSAEETTIETSGNKVTELGLAEVIRGGQDNKKFLALHRTAPVGTIVQIKNEMNNLSVFVRVVGQLPETGVNNKVAIKISKEAYDRLGAVDQRFPVELSYLKP